MILHLIKPRYKEERRRGRSLYLTGIPTTKFHNLKFRIFSKIVLGRREKRNTMSLFFFSTTPNQEIPLAKAGRSIFGLKLPGTTSFRVL
jgi:hypothetical protein